jgi:diguanylate cyclase (GGDEF)-like protein
MEPIKSILVVDPSELIDSAVLESLARDGFRPLLIMDLPEQTTLAGTDEIQMALVASPVFDNPLREILHRINELNRNLPILFLLQGQPPKEFHPELEGLFWWHVMPLEERELLAMVRLASDFYQLKKSGRDLSSRLQMKDLELTIFNEIGKTITSTLQLKRVLNIIINNMTDIIHSEAWSLSLVDEKTNNLAFEAGVGSKADQTKNVQLKMGQGIAGWVAREAKPIIIPDVTKDLRFLKALEESPSFGTKSILCVPLISKGKVLGVIELINKVGGDPFDKRDLDLLSTLADFAAIAIENARLYQRTEDLSITDDVTSVHNARYFYQILEREIKRVDRYHSILSLLFMDLDHFKPVNDTYGHLMGSAVLREVAILLKQNLREVDLVARYGGDEFVVILPETDTQTACKLADRLSGLICNHCFLIEKGLQIKISASFGVASYPSHAKTKEDLIRLADKSMYQAKASQEKKIFHAGETSA